MKILNLHGYHGDPQNCAFTALKARGQTVFSPSLDYDSLSPETILGALRKLIMTERIDMLAGTSLGGFYAAVLAAESGLPVLLVNPCLMPFLHLPRLGFTGDIRPYITLFASVGKLNSDQVSCIVGGADEIIDTHDFAERLFGNERFRIVPEGKHAGATLHLEEYLEAVLPD